MTLTGRNEVRVDRSRPSYWGGLCTQIACVTDKASNFVQALLTRTHASYQ